MCRIGGIVVADASYSYDFDAPVTIAIFFACAPGCFGRLHVDYRTAT
jgi:hypothetical protein